MAMSRLKSLLVAGALALPLLSASPADALNIVLRPDDSFKNQPGGADALFAFRKAANYWNTVLTNDTTLYFDVSYAALGANIIGSTGSNGIDVSTQSVYRGLAGNARTNLDTTAVANLRPLTAAGGVGYRAPAPVTALPTDPNRGLGLETVLKGSIYDNNDSVNNTVIAANTANAKVLGLQFDYANSYTGSDADADITFSSAFNFDFNPSDGLSRGSQDFISVAVHEMGHALGFVSGTDTYDFFASPNGPCAKISCAPGLPPGDAIDFDTFGSILSVWDLYRYSTNGPATSGFDPATGKRFLQLDPNRGAGFSIDGVNFFNPGGPGGFANLATGRYNGDGSQASHWKDSTGFTGIDGCFNTNPQIGIMDPTSGSCQMGFITANDLAAFDAMGYNLDFDILQNLDYAFSSASVYNLAGLANVVLPVPEPSTWAQLMLGVGLIGGIARRRRADRKTAIA